MCIDERFFRPGFISIKIGSFDTLFPSIETREKIPNYTIEEYPERYEIIVELPGVKKEDIELYISDNSLFLRAQKKIFEKTEIYKLKLRFNSNIESEGYKAKYENGLLELSIKKATVKKIKID